MAEWGEGLRGGHIGGGGSSASARVAAHAGVVGMSQANMRQGWLVQTEAAS